jgi:peroxiredoxin
MVLKSSVMLPLGTKAPDFSLPDPGGRKYTLKGFNGAPAILVVFMCNHCPYVKHVQRDLAALVKEYQAKGVAVVGISSNDIEAYPDDAPGKMREEAAVLGYTFPYLFDESQNVAKAYHAVCTPDFFLFDKEQKLAYRGQMDSSRPGNGIPVTGRDLRAALDAVLAGRPPDPLQRPSAGCSIKWKPGGEPEWM